MPEIEYFPTNQKSVDRVRDLAQDLGIPGLGFLVRQTVAAPLEKRQENWFNGIRDVLERHEKKLQDMSQRSDPRIDEIISLIAEGYGFSAKTHLDEKLRMFLTAIENAIITDTDYEIASVFLRLAQDLQPFHLKLLSVYSDTETHYERMQPIAPLKGRTDLVMSQLVVSDSQNIADYLPVAEGDLEARSLIDRNQYTRIFNGQIIIRGAITRLGTDFLNFVANSTDERKTR